MLTPERAEEDLPFFLFSFPLFRFSLFFSFFFTLIPFSFPSPSMADHSGSLSFSLLHFLLLLSSSFLFLSLLPSLFPSDLLSLSLSASPSLFDFLSSPLFFFSSFPLIKSF